MSIDIDNNNEKIDFENELQVIKMFHILVDENNLNNFSKFCMNWMVKNGFDFIYTMNFFEKHNINAFIEANKMTEDMKESFGCCNFWDESELEKQHYACFHIGTLKYINDKTSDIDKINNMELLKKTGFLMHKNKPTKTGNTFYDPIDFHDFLLYVNDVNGGFDNCKIKLTTLMEFHLKWKRKEYDSDLSLNQLEILNKFFIDYES